LADPCPSCGRPLDEHDRHVRIALPDPVLAVPAEQRAARTWGADPLMQVQGVGAFVRVLLPIRLTGAASLTVGTWLGIDPGRLTGVWERWETDAYATLELDGYLANAIPPWGDQVFGSPATGAVIDPSSFPYLRTSSEPVLDSILTRAWPHEEILEAYASIL
jgi:hypothetical protein